MKRIYFLIAIFIIAIAVSAYFIKEGFFAPPRMNSCFDRYDRRIDCTTRQLIEGNPTGTGGGARTYGGSDGLLATRGLLGTNRPSGDFGYDGGVKYQIDVGDWDNGDRYNGPYTDETMYHGGDYGNLFEGETRNSRLTSGSGRSGSGSGTGSGTGSGSGRSGSGSGTGSGSGRSGSGSGTGSGSGIGTGTGTGTGTGSGQIVAPTLTLSTTTKVSDIIAYGNALLNVANTIKTRLNSTPNRVPTLTTQDVTTLGAMYVGETPSTVTFGKLLIAVEKDIETLNSGKTIATNMLRDGKITNNDTFLTAIPKLFPETGTNVNTLAQSYISGGNNIIGRITTIINIFNRITQPLPRPNQPPTTVNPNPGGADAEADLDSSNNNVRVSLNDLLSAINVPSFSNDDRRDRRPHKRDYDDDHIVRIPTPIKPVETPCLDQYYSVLKPQIQKDISTAIHDEFARVTAPPNSVPITTPATQQGCSMQEVQQQMQPQADMSQYIRKDSVPCWGCSGL